MALFLSVTTTCRFGLNHKGPHIAFFFFTELPLWCWRGVRESVACGFLPQENKETKLREASLNQDQTKIAICHMVCCWKMSDCDTVGLALEPTSFYLVQIGSNSIQYPFLLIGSREEIKGCQLKSCIVNQRPHSQTFFLLQISPKKSKEMRKKIHIFQSFHAFCVQ